MYQLSTVHPANKLYDLFYISGKGDNLEDLFFTLKEQITTSGWLGENTSDKWVNANPELAKEYMDAAKKS